LFYLSAKEQFCPQIDGNVQKVHLTASISKPKGATAAREKREPFLLLYEQASCYLNV
jgi:hypothetical protein